jgi:cell division protein FtsB
MSSPRWLKFWALVNGALVVGLVGSAIFGKNGVVQHEKLNDDLIHTREINADLERQNAALRREIRSLSTDDEYVESVIRDELGWVRPDELIILFPDDR